jgi:hypothetical protein
VSRHYCHHHGCCLWLLAVLGMAMVYGVLLAAWLAWAAVVLPAAGITWAAGHRGQAGRMVHTLRWDVGALVGP